MSMRLASWRCDWPYLVLDGLPDDPGHLIAVKLHDRVLDLDLLDSRRGRHPVLSDVRIEAWCGGGGGARGGPSRAGQLCRSRSLGS
jgi:hypothetical protein